LGKTENGIVVVTAYGVFYGLKQSKNELGWADYRLTHYPDIERW
jgi:hypothetical protein